MKKWNDIIIENKSTKWEDAWNDFSKFADGYGYNSDEVREAIF